jgi:hypothetical protein
MLRSRRIEGVEERERGDGAEGTWEEKRESEEGNEDRGGRERCK